MQCLQNILVTIYRGAHCSVYIKPRPRSVLCEIKGDHENIE